MATEPALGTRIKRARERLRWTQKRLADAVGVSQKTIDNWENGRTEPRSSVGALEEVLGTRLDDEPEQRPSLSPALLREIMNTEGLTLEQRQALIRGIEEMLASERGTVPGAEAEGSPRGTADGQEQRHRPAS